MSDSVGSVWARAEKYSTAGCACTYKYVVKESLLSKGGHGTPFVFRVSICILHVNMFVNI